MLRFLGIPYIWGGDDPMRGFDCSGGAQEALAMLGLDPAGDQNCQALYDHFSDPKRSVEGARDTGSLAFYGHDSKSITHVAVFLDSETIFEFGGGGSKTTSVEKAIEQNAYGRIRPYWKRTDLVAIVNPKGLPW